LIELHYIKVLRNVWIVSRSILRNSPSSTKLLWYLKAHSELSCLHTFLVFGKLIFQIV
jgi:hypothetical protein